jgi:hypothetical protein
MRILLGAVVSLHPYSPGMAWHRLQYAVGLRRLGHEVHWVEELGAAHCTTADGRPAPYERSANRERFRSTLGRFGLLAAGCQIYDGGEETCGLTREQLTAAAKDADLLLNMSGHVRADWVLEHVRRRAYVDQDPVYTQLWAAEYGADLNFAAHDVFFSVGLNVGTPHSPVPTCDVDWRSTLPPVVPDLWPVANGAAPAAFATIASWSGAGELSYRGRTYGSKYREFRRLAELPSLSGQQMQVALKPDSYRDDDEGILALRAGGWTVVDGGAIGDLDSYQAYIRSSRAEIGVAKNAYVEGSSGWFSDRSSHFLASGRPVLAQSTGFERCLPTGVGLMTFRTLDEARDGVERINRDYRRHCIAARAFAEEHLDYRTVLTTLLDACG